MTDAVESSKLCAVRQRLNRESNEATFFRYRDVLLIVSDHVEEEKKAVAPKPKGTAKRSRPKTGAARHRDSESERSEEDEEIAVVATKPKKSRHKSPPVTTLD